MADAPDPPASTGTIPPIDSPGALPEDLTGCTVNRYLVQGRLGAGGMGEVYRAEDPVLRRLVALKRMLRHGASETERAHFLREGQRASSLAHPNIAGIHDVLIERGEVLLVIEYIPGETLRQRLTRSLSLAEFYAIATQCADALALAHERGILHGDVKPENMMLTTSGTLKLLDFGVARRLLRDDAPTETSLTAAASLAGTPRYMAPELFSGHPPDERADIFALGVVMYEMLSGRHPFAAPTQAGSIGQILHEQPAALQKAASGPLSFVIDKALAKDPDQRYPSAQQLGADLRTLAAGGRIRKSASPQRPAPSHRALWGLGALAALLLLAGLGFLLRTRARPGAAPPQTADSPLLAPHRNLAVMVASFHGGDARQQALGNGFAESIATKLSELGATHDLAIVSPQELHARGAATLAQAREDFGANLGLSVSLETANNLTRAAYSLVNAKTGSILAGATATASASDLFALEDEVASGVAQELHLTLRPEESRALAANATQQPDAYRYYLQALGYLHESLDPQSPARAQILLKEALRLDPRYGAAQAGLGEAFWRLYKATRQQTWIDQAKAACQAAVALGNAGAQGHICLGTLASGTGAPALAAREFEEAVRLEPSNDSGYIDLAKAYQQLNQPDRAEQTFQNAIHLRPEYWRGYNSLGAFYIAQSQYEKAAAMFARAASLAPENYSLANNLGGSLLYLGRDQQASQAFQRSIAIHPSYDGYANIGAAYFRLRRFPDAVRSYHEALKLDPSDYATWGDMGDSYYYGGDPRAATQAYRKAIALAEQQLKVNPADSEVLGDLASYHSMVGDTAQAAELIDRALLLERGDKGLLFTAALVYNQLHRTEDALKWLGKALKAGYSRPVIASAPAFDNLHPDPRYIALMKQP